MRFSTQMVRFLTVGLITNASLYTAYLAITSLGLEHKLAMTLVYVSGVVMGFLFNRNWTFRHNGQLARGFMRYASIYFAGYVVNFCGLFLLVDIFGYPHQIMQLIIGALLMGVFFIAQRYWIFKHDGKPVSDYGG